MARHLRSLTVLGLALAAGCSSSSTSATPTAPPVTETTTAPSPTEPIPTTVSPTTSPTPSPTPARTAAPVAPSESPAPLGQPTCAAAAVTITDADTTSTPTASREVFALRTTGRTCQLEGFPTVVVGGVTAAHNGQGLPAEKPAAYTLSSGNSLSFVVATARSGSCREITSITVTLPGSATARPVSTDLRLCGTVVGVSPVHRVDDPE